MSICTVKHLPQLKFRRAGIIPYMIKENGHINFALGADRKHSIRNKLSIGSFSGSIISKETVVEAAVREFSEETLNAFGKINIKDISDCVAIYNHNEVIIFVKMIWDENRVKLLFNHRVNILSEISEIVFIDFDDMMKLINGIGKNIMYGRVKNLILTTIENYGNFFTQPIPA